MIFGWISSHASSFIRTAPTWLLSKNQGGERAAGACGLRACSHVNEVDSKEPKCVALVTGSTDGIGRETARCLARAGAQVIIHGRDPKRVRATQESLGGERQGVDGICFDLSDFSNVKDAGKEVLVRHPDINLLVNNAGVFLPRRTLTSQGLEATFAINHLGHFALTQVLMDALQDNAPGRIIIVTSAVHTRAKVLWSRRPRRWGYNGYGVYAASKLANVLHTVELAARVRDRGVTVNSLHPGVARTKLLRAGVPRGGDPIERAAEAVSHLALAPEVAQVTGQYFVEGQPAAMSPLAQDPVERLRLWRLSEQLTHV